MSLKQILSAFLPVSKLETRSENSGSPIQSAELEDTDPTYEERAAEQRRILIDALQQHRAAFWAFKMQIERETPHQRWGYADEYKRIVAEQPILKDTPQARIGMVIAITYWLTEKTKDLEDVKLIDRPQYSRAAQYLVTRLLNYKLPYTPADLTLILNLLGRHAGQRDNYYLQYYPVSIMLKRVEELVEQSGLNPDMERALMRFREIITRKNNEHRRIRLRIQALLDETILSNLESGLPWLDALKEDVQAMEPAQRQAWEALIEHGLAPRSTKPSKIWLAKASKIINAIGEDAFKANLLRWFSQIEPGINTSIPATVEDVLRGLIWACLLIDDNNLAHVIGDLALIFLTKVRGHGPLSQKTGYACLYTLSRMASDGAIGELYRIQPRVKLAKIRRKVATALDEAASRRGLNMSELEENAIPDFGWDAERCYPERPGGYRAKFAYRPGGRICVDWFNPNGKRLKSTPSLISSEYAETLQRIRQNQKTANKLFATQRIRMERLFIEERTWSLMDWRVRYLDHPFVSLLARLVIWRFETGEQHTGGIWLNGQLVDQQGSPIEWLTDNTQVSIWHPLECETEIVLAWQTFLEDHQITQPFKQAHREIYVLTDAEIETNTYSNRFAAHILRHVPFFGVIRKQGWKYSTSYGQWNNYRTPTLEVPHANLKAQYWVDPIHDPEIGEGVHKCISTDQVRFIGEDGEPIPLAQVPSRVFSEAMRDIDIFVGATSIGADPRWQDQGERPVAMRNYWQDFSFGELSTTAANRREVLERLLPKLKIADQTRLTDKFLIVNGEIRTYKIHLGSGNILMAPNDQYLCIVASRNQSPPNLFLPFEGDSALAVILSKAFLLADDRQIKDPTITRQIKRSV